MTEVTHPIYYAHSAGDAIPMGSVDGRSLLLDQLVIQSADPSFWAAIAKAAADNKALCAQRWRKGSF